MNTTTGGRPIDPDDPFTPTSLRRGAPVAPSVPPPLSRPAGPRTSQLSPPATPRPAHTPARRRGRTAVVGSIVVVAALIARLFYGTNEDAVREFCASVANQHATFFSADKSATETAGRWAFTLYNLGLVGLHPPGGLWTLTHPDLTTKYQALVDFVDVAAHRSETSDAATESYHYARFRSECPT